MRKQFGARPSKLDLEKWKEAVERFVEKAASENLNFIVSEMGELFNSKSSNNSELWYKNNL